MTIQVPEEISYEGIELQLLVEPDLPLAHPRLESIPEHDPDYPTYISTACFRNYIGRWAVRQGVLYLVGVDGAFRLRPGPEIPATWFSGVLRMPTGGLIARSVASYMPTFCSEFFAQVDRGIVVRTWNESNEAPDEDA
jgi:hypothetical protein